MDNAAAMAAMHRKGNVGDNFGDVVFSAQMELIVALWRQLARERRVLGVRGRDWHFAVECL
jgi:hypothetical protein